MASRTWHVYVPCAISPRKRKRSCRCVLSYVVPLVALVIYLGYMNLWGIPVLLDFDISFAVKLPFSIEEVRQTCAQCTTCSALKPRFYQPPRNKFDQSHSSVGTHQHRLQRPSYNFPQREQVPFDSCWRVQPFPFCICLQRYFNFIRD